MRSPPRLAAVLLALAVLDAHPAGAVEIALEVQLGVGFPLLPFPSGVPLPYADPSGAIVGQPSSSVNLLLDLQPEPGFSCAASLLLNQFTLRTAFSVHTLARPLVTDLAVSRYSGMPLPQPLPNVYLKRLLGLDLSSLSFDLPRYSPLFVLRFTLGYRFYLLERRLRPYVPLGIGPAVTFFEGQTLPGLDLHLGLGCEYRVTDSVDVGLALQYEWTGVFLPDTFQAQTSDTLTGAVSAGDSVLGAFLKSLHTLQLGVTSTWRF